MLFTIIVNYYFLKPLKFYELPPSIIEIVASSIKGYHFLDSHMKTCMHFITILMISFLTKLDLFDNRECTSLFLFLLPCTAPSLKQALRNVYQMNEV